MLAYLSKKVHDPLEELVQFCFFYSLSEDVQSLKSYIVPAAASRETKID